MNKLALAASISLFLVAGCGSADQQPTQKQPIVSEPSYEGEGSGNEAEEETQEEADPEGPQCVPLGDVCFLGRTPCCEGSTCVAEPSMNPSLTVTAHCREIN